jgi:transcriptional/translational regulatory protein YebC/TACO1
LGTSLSIKVLHVCVVKKINKMLDMFDDNDDVQDVYHNAELPEEEE